MRQKHGFFFLFVCIISILVFILHSLFTKTSVFADAKFYYSYTRSLIFDHNLLLGNEYFRLNLLNAFPENQFFPSFYPPGVSFFWLPLFYLTLGFLNLLKLFIPGITITGYETVFEYACGVTSIVLAAFGLYLTFKVLSKYFSKITSLYSVATLFFASNLFFYMAVEPINSHAVSFFVSALFLYYFIIHKNNKYYYLILGILGGISGLIRTQDALLLILPVIKLFFGYKRGLKIIISNFVYLSLGFLLGFSPQILMWKYFYNTYFYSPYMSVGFNFLKPKIIHVLFNGQNGLFTLTPIIALAILGVIFQIYLFIKTKKDRIKDNKIGIYFMAFLYFILQLYLISSWNNYFQGGSYSIRMIVTTYPLLAFGLAFLIKESFKKMGSIKTAGIIAFFSVINFISILNYLLKF